MNGDCMRPPNASLDAASKSPRDPLRPCTLTAGEAASMINGIYLRPRRVASQPPAGLLPTPPLQPTETMFIVPAVPIDEVYGAVKPAVGGSGMLPCIVRVMLWSPEILRALPSRV